LLQNVEVAEPLTPEELHLEQSKLRNDVDIVRAYGETRPDEWADFFFDNDPTVRIVTLFAGPNAEVHERALRGLVSYPDQLEVRRSKFSRYELEEILQKVRHLSRSSPGVFLSTGITRGGVCVQLAADQEELAEAFLAKHQDAVELKVGAFPYPMPEQASPLLTYRPAQYQSAVPLITSEGLDVTIANDLVVETGRTGRGFLVFTNVGSGDVVLDTNGWITGKVVDPATGEVVGGDVGMQTMPLVQYSITPGETVSIPLLVGTASFRRDLGYAIPPGEWEINAVVKVHNVGERQVPNLPIVIVNRSERS
jgi:hypothetical protein